jgi:hypothetical protein
MNIVEIKTLIDITNSGVERPYQGSQLELNQNRNWTTLSQCIGIRSIIEYYNSPIVETVDVKGLDFGSNFKGKHQVWTFRFETDRPEVFGEDCELLIEDMDQVPVIKKLTESVNIDKSIFELVDDKYRNTIIKALRNTV